MSAWCLTSPRLAASKHSGAMKAGWGGRQGRGEGRSACDPGPEPEPEDTKALHADAGHGQAKDTSDISACAPTTESYCAGTAGEMLRVPDPPSPRAPLLTVPASGWAVACVASRMRLRPKSCGQQVHNETPALEKRQVSVLRDGRKMRAGLYKHLADTHRELDHWPVGVRAVQQHVGGLQGVCVCGRVGR